MKAFVDFLSYVFLAVSAAFMAAGLVTLHLSLLIVSALCAIFALLSDKDANAKTK